MKKKLLIALCLPLVTIIVIGAAQMIPGSVGYPPAGSNGQIQYYNNGALGASTNLIWTDSTTNLALRGKGPSISLTDTNNPTYTTTIKQFYALTATDPSFVIHTADQDLLSYTYNSRILKVLPNPAYSWSSIEMVGPTVFDSSIKFPIITKSTNYTLTISDHTVLAAADGLTLTFPSTTNIAGRIYRVKLITPAVSLTLTNSNGIELFDGALSHSMTTSNTCAAFQTDGTNWWKISN